MTAPRWLSRRRTGKARPHWSTGSPRAAAPLRSAHSCGALRSSEDGEQAREQDGIWMLSSRGSQCSAPAQRARSALPQAWPREQEDTVPAAQGKESDASGTNQPAHRAHRCRPQGEGTVLPSGKEPRPGERDTTQPSATCALQDHSTPSPRGSGGTTANPTRSGW